MNGLSGLKPTWGRVSRAGVFALAESMDHIGPMTRSAADAAAMLGAIAGADPEDPTALPDPVPDYLASIDAGVKGMRIGIDRAFVAAGAEPAMARVAEEACAEFARLLAERANDPEARYARIRFASPFDMSRHPSLTLPGGQTAEGLPIGFQIVGRHLDEARILRAGHAFQRATQWHSRRPGGAA